MLPLSLAQQGEENIIKRVGGNQETKSIWKTLALLSAVR